ncbi:hypothetical protein EPA93_06710 [Ktedonosporobacter rubrisoli]|uniref:Uncharacterized protein n=1 Tax=Ktedonosporobacter rubrisoli TaxID=2509675 RepID=A0A4P6JL48_KTERU|nr:hypothetical protein [Ktedonosporobacter rubrisoli]QBD75712.1 hypothetical protein EPA93_06710 [Ktedonosporobacter rubrisoli]
MDVIAHTSKNTNVSYFSSENANGSLFWCEAAQDGQVSDLLEEAAVAGCHCIACGGCDAVLEDTDEIS